MTNKPEAGELLQIARDTFTDRILPALPENLRYTGLMIANALAIARRDIESGSNPARAELQRLLDLFGEPSRELHEDQLRSTLAECNRRLVREIRSGRYDRDNAALLEHLRQTTDEKLAISNPRMQGGK